MKRVFLVLLILCLVIFSCYNSEERIKETVKDPVVSFDQVGYYKSDNKLRYFNFHINTEEKIDRENITDKLFNLIENHGSKQMHTAGRVAASFYYIDLKDTPDITLLSAQRANTIAHDRRPLAVVWIMPKGNVNIFINPE